MRVHLCALFFLSFSSHQLKFRSLFIQRTIGWLYTGIQRVQTQQISIADQILHSKYIQQRETETLESCCSRAWIVQRLLIFHFFFFSKSFVQRLRFFFLHPREPSFDFSILHLIRMCLCFFSLFKDGMEATWRNVPW